MPKTIKISLKTHRQLIQIKGKLEAKDGKRRTLEDTVIELINHFNRSETK